MGRKLYELTPEHRAELAPWAQRWIANAMSTAPMTEADREVCRRAVAGIYAAAKLPPPKHIVFVPSPFVLAFAGGFSSAIWWLSRNKRAATRDATEDATRAATRDATWAATWAATRDATWAATWAATRGATWGATWADLSNWYVVGADMRRLAQAMGLDGFGLQCAAHAWRMWQGGNQWSGYDSYLSFFRHIASLDIDYSAWQHWEDLSLNSGPRIMHPDFCMVSDRPETLLVDDRNRPHCDTGPFCRWRDGTALYSVHGVRVPAWLIERPGDLTAAKIDAETNAEVRRIMLDRFGAARWLTESGAKVVDEAPADHPLLGLRTARLLRRDVQDDEPILLVDLLNSTPEPDGSTKRYQIRVSPNEYGGESSKNVLAAVASTWRLPDGSLAFRTWRDYAPQVET